MKEGLLTCFDGSKMYYRFSKPRKRNPVVLFLHGLGNNHTVFSCEESVLKKEGYGILNIDLRAHGKSRPSNNHDDLYDACSKDILSLLKFHKIRKVVVAGYSLGGLVGLYFYKKFPSRVSGMVLIDSSSTFSFKNVSRKMMLLAPLAVCVNFIADCLKPFFGRKEIDFNSLKKASMFKIVFLSSYLISIKDILGYLQQGRNIDMKGIFSGMNVPVLIIESKKDQIFRPQSFLDMERMIEDSDLEFVDGDHLTPLRDPSLMADMIKGFLEENSL